MCDFERKFTSNDSLKARALDCRIPRGHFNPKHSLKASTLHFAQAIGEFKAGKVEYRADKTGIVHVPFGKSDFPAEDLLTNLVAVAVCVMPAVLNRSSF